jgi:hypothetical protein
MKIARLGRTDSQRDGGCSTDCKLRLEGIVSKRKGSPYRSGRSPLCLPMPTPRERFHRSLARRLISVRRRTVLVLAV